jgi:hypothetical protein
LGDGGWGIGDGPQSPIPNPQSPIPNPHLFSVCYLFLYILFLFKLKYIFFRIKKYKNIYLFKLK